MRRSLRQLYQINDGKVSDKWSLYLDEYDRIFSNLRTCPINLLEIGIQNGGSLEIWSHYFLRAEKLIGCDINPDCHRLTFDDSRIVVVVADINLDKSEEAILSHAPHFEVIIDDGSHRSSDIIRSFARFFPHLAKDGLYVVEDLHCSYWADFEGGLFDPYSAVSFFKRLTDLINHEHWGVDVARNKLLNGFSLRYGASFEENTLSLIHSVEFINSMCVIRKAAADSNQLGPRVISGQQEVVVGGLFSVQGKTCIVPNQSTNTWSVNLVPPEEELPQILSKLVESDAQIATINQAVVERDMDIVELKQKNTELKQVITESEWKISSLTLEVNRTNGDNDILSKVITERNVRTSILQEKLAKRDGQIDQLIEAASQYNQRIDHLTEVVSQRDWQISNMKNDLVELLTSKSWVITTPFRTLANKYRSFQYFFRMLPARLKQEGGFKVYVSKAMALIRNEGLIGIKHRLFSNKLPAHLYTSKKYDSRIQQDNVLSIDESKQILHRNGAISEHPKISVIMVVFDPPLEFLDLAIQSVRNQCYFNWELCVEDSSCKNRAASELLQQYAAEDSRIRVFSDNTDRHNSYGSNLAIDFASGEYICFLDQDGCLHKEALSELARVLHEDSKIDMVYTDEDQISINGERNSPFFKPDWSPHLAISQAYLGHLVCYRTRIVKELGCLRGKVSSSQNYDLWLRSSSVASKIEHIPRILYHWRKREGNLAENAETKPYAHEEGRIAVAGYLAHRYPEFKSQVIDGEHLFTYQVKFSLPSDLLVSIIIPTRDRVDLLKPCVDSILLKSSWENFEIIILDNGSQDQTTLDYLDEVSRDDYRVRVISADIPFNWSRLNNIGAKAARGEVFIFLNNDTQVISASWVESLAGYARLPDVGVVGALLLFEDGTIQHSGVVVGMGGWADHVFRTRPPEHWGTPFVSPVLTRNVLAVTGACTAIARDKFEKLGGYDEAFIICGSDVELGLRAHHHNLYNVLCAEVKLFHYESKTRSSHVPESDFKLSELKYAPYRVDQVDPFYNPNLSLTSTTPTRKNLENHS